MFADRFQQMLAVTGHGVVGQCHACPIAEGQEAKGDEALREAQGGKRPHHIFFIDAPRIPPKALHHRHDAVQPVGGAAWTAPVARGVEQ